VIEIKDLIEKAKGIQDKENLDLISGTDVPVQPWHDHEGHLASLADFMNDMFFENLPMDIKLKVDAHKQMHVEEFAKLKAEAEPPPEGGGAEGLEMGAPPGGAKPPPGMPASPTAAMTAGPAI
jgi:hypothetical protein